MYSYANALLSSSSSLFQKLVESPDQEHSKQKINGCLFLPSKTHRFFFFFLHFFSFCIEIRNGCRSVRVIAPWCISPKFLLVWSLFPPSIVYFPCTTKSHWGFHCWKSGTMFPSWVFPSSLFPQLHMNPEQRASRCSPS